MLHPLCLSTAPTGAPIVLLHASYPYGREAGYLASVYEHVYLDYGLAVPLLSAAGMQNAVAALLELGPSSKLMFSTDAHFYPEVRTVHCLTSIVAGGRRVPALLK